jgi:hypothetical protein
VKAVAFHELKSFDIEDTVELAINRMEMGEAVFTLTEIHLDNDAIKSSNDWHSELLLPI